MVIPDITVETPRSLEEAVRLLACGDDVAALAGGTGLLPALKLGLRAPARLVDLSGIENWAQLETEGAGVYLGPGVHLCELASDERILRDFPALAEAAAAVGSPQLRNMATVGGNLCLDTRCRFYDRTALWRNAAPPCLKLGGDSCLAVPRARRCHAVFAADLPPALIALGARVRVACWKEGRVAERELDLEDLYQDEGRSWLRLRPDEVVSRVVLLPRVSAGDWRSGYRKYRVRRSIDFPLASVAVSLRLEEGVMRGVRVVLGGVASAPVVARAAMEELEGRRPAEARLEQVAALAARAAHPVPNQAGTPGQRRLMIEVLTRELIGSLTGSPESRGAEGRP